MNFLVVNLKETCVVFLRSMCIARGVAFIRAVRAVTLKFFGFSTLQGIFVDKLNLNHSPSSIILQVGYKNDAVIKV